MTTKHLSVSLAGVLAIVSSAAMAQYTGVSHPDEATISTNNSAATTPVQAPSVAPVDRYATTQTVAPINVVAVGNAAPTLNTPASVAPGPSVADQDGGVVVRVAGPSDRLPEGTLMKVRLRETLSTKRTRDGSEWSAELLEPLERDGQVLVPAGSVLRGKVTEVHGGKRIHGQAAIHLTTLSMTLPDGSTRGIHAQVIDTELNHALRVDREGTILHRDHRAEQAGVLALTAGSGAVAGGIIAGVPGALVGAGVGAGVSGVLYLKEDKQAELPQGTVVTFELTRSMGFGPE